MSPTLRRARVLHDLAEFGAGAAGLFTAAVHRRHLSVVAVPPAPGPGQLPNRFAQLPGLRSDLFDHEAAVTR